MISINLPTHPHSLDLKKIQEDLKTSSIGIKNEEAAERLSQFGPNELPQAKSISLVKIAIRQFLSPLIYVLLAACFLSIVLGHMTDAVFIFLALLINAVIGAIQEYNAEKSSLSLRNLVISYSDVIREGETYKIPNSQLVPGDLVLLESGDRVPADLRLTFTNNFEVDESLLTGESLSVSKNKDDVLNEKTLIADQKNMTFAGTLVTRGRAQGWVTATALQTQLGKIASSLTSTETVKPPLLLRMEEFTKKITLFIGILVLLIAFIFSKQGASLAEVLMFSIALAVSAIPEGLPIGITVALSIAVRRMSRKAVIVRKLVAVESLGSCTFIATDKTGTLTLNQLTAKSVALPEEDIWEVSGEGIEPVGEFTFPKNHDSTKKHSLAEELSIAGVLCNEAVLSRKNHGWVAHGDSVDIAMLVMAHKLGITKQTAENTSPLITSIPFESEKQFSAVLSQCNHESVTFVKGAFERVSSMCQNMSTAHGEKPINQEGLSEQAQKLAEKGYKVIALARGKINLNPGEAFDVPHLKQLTFLGLVGLIDPLRSEAKEAVLSCKKAGIQVAMVTGDHPTTAFAIAKELGLAESKEQIITGTQLRECPSDAEKQHLLENVHVFARVEPRQKLEIVQALSQLGHYVAVTGDGANDAPAMKTAHVGVAMGAKGTDVAKETADLVITDDNFSSIVGGIEEGRVAYANIRKIIYLLIATGLGEIILMLLSMISGLPIPLTAVQILWLNLVANGIQDVALAFEKAEGDEMSQSPRPPKEPVFNRMMLERCFISASVVGVVSFLVFSYLLKLNWPIEQARNSLLLLLVLFENIQAGNSRSELKSLFCHNPFKNPLLIYGTLAAQLVHIAAMYIPGISGVLQLQGVPLNHWCLLLLVSLTVFLAIEIHKLFRRKFSLNSKNKMTLAT